MAKQNEDADINDQPKPVDPPASPPPPPEPDRKAKILAIINKHLPDRGHDGEALWGRVRRLLIEMASVE